MISQKLLAAAMLWWLVAGTIGPANAAGADTNSFKPQAAPGAGLFTDAAVPRIRIDITPSDMAELRQSSRKYVSAVVRDGKEIYQRVAIHLKGSTGSFRGLDDKPGLTLDFVKFAPGQRFHGLQKIHLNNSVEDPSYLNEALGSELFRAAGVPAPRVAHALVELNGRQLGLYVLKEGFTEDFLGLYFRQPKGNLYEPGLGHDADEPLKAVSGDGPADPADLKALAAAAREPDLGRRWQRLDQVLDLERFVSFMAMEVMAGHRDGYCLARNNFRIYHDLDTGKILFFPHGMDQLFGKPDAPMQPRMNGLIARAVMETPEGRQRYRQRFAFLLTNVFSVPILTERADVVVKHLRPVLGFKEARAVEREIAAVKDRMSRRRRELEKQLSALEPKPLQFEHGIARLADWQMVDKPVNGIMDRASAPGGKAGLRIRAGPATSASWRTKVWLPKGRYRFEGAVCTTGVEPLNFGKNQGASLRVAGMVHEKSGNLTGSHAWRTVPVEFDITALEQEVDLICELRARQGEAWFDLDSLRLLRLPGQ